MTIWDEKFASEEFLYGKEPNVFFKSVIDRLPKGKLLVPGAGEGRDAVYAATLGWEVVAFDQSAVARGKALRLAEEMNTHITFHVVNAAEFDFEKEQFDLVAMTFFHLSPDLRKLFFANIYKSLKTGGHLVIEGFNPLQLEYRTGGPSHLDMLFTPVMLAEELVNIQPVENSELLVTLAEGRLHQGTAAVIRFEGYRI